MKTLTESAPVANIQPAPRRVLVIGTFLSSSGSAPNVVEEVADRLETRGVTIRRTSHIQNRIARLAHQLGTIARHRNSTDLAYLAVFSGPAFIWAEASASLLKAFGIPYVAFLHGGLLPEFARSNPRRVTRVLRHAAEVYAPSAFLQRELSPYRPDIGVLPNGVDLSQISGHVRSVVEPNLAWLRSIHSIYNPSQVPEVVARLASEFPSVQATMYGPDKRDGSLEALKARIAELGMASRLNIAGRIPKSEVGRALGGHDIFLNTTDIDNTPVSVIEAMASGMCIVSTNVGGVPDLIRDGEDGLLVPPRDPERMAAAVRRLLVEPGLAAQLSANAIERARQFDWPGILDRWDEIYRRCARRS